MKFVLSTVLIILNLVVAAQALPYELQSPQVFQVNRMAARVTSFAYENERLAKQGDKTMSANFMSLNGKWKFHWVQDPRKRPLDFFKTDFDDRAWDDFTVPANWELNHYGYPIYVNVPYDFAGRSKMNDKLHPPFDIPVDNNPVGSYRKKFILPQNWKDKQVFIHLGAVKSAFFIWVNGNKTGYSEDSKLAAEFDITPWLKTGENLIALEVYRWSDGSYQECQDMWRFSGIERDVYLYATPKIDVRDVAIHAVLDNDYKTGILNITAEVNNYIFEKTNTSVPEKFSVAVELADKTGKIIYKASEQEQYVRGRYFTAVQFKTRIASVHQWSAETPWLYTLYITLKDKHNKVLEVIPQKIGFKKIEIIGNDLLVNGKRVFLKGVNRHEHHPTNGHVLTREWMRKDMEMMKKLNINAVRHSHYPPDPYWLQLCDEYGLYVIDEANMESHGLGYELNNQLGNRPEWSDAILARSQRMYERDKNHASVIIWSMGNESGDGAAFYRTYDWLKSKTNLPVQYEGADGAGYTDVFAPMYLSPEALLQRAKADKRPTILCEYAHIMGNSMGNFNDYWKVIKAAKGLQGGFIWEWLDQSIDTIKNGKRIKAYGGDFPLEGPVDNNFSDNNFCVKGVVTAYRNLTPMAIEVKKVYQDIHTTLDAQNKLVIKNEYFFKSLNNIYATWQLLEDGSSVAEGSLPALNIAPQKTAHIPLPIKYNLQKHKEYFFNIFYRLKNEEPFLYKGDTVAYEQFQLQSVMPRQYNPSAKAVLQTQEKDNRVEISGTDFKIIFDKAKGSLSQYILNGIPVFENACRPAFWRAPVDNDIGAGFNKDLRMWRNASEDAVITMARTEPKEYGSVLVHFTASLLNGDATVTQDFCVYSDGAVKVQNHFYAHKGDYPLLLRMGNNTEMNKDFNKIIWYGRGPWENYWDRKTASLTGIHQSVLAAQYFPYARPQESGNKTDVRWVQFKNSRGEGVAFIYLDSLLNFSALPYSLNDLDPEMEKKQYHSGELIEKDKIYLHIDLQQSGVGGIDSWGAWPLDKYRLKYKNYNYSYLIKPVK